MYLVECKPDEVLVKSLAPTSRRNVKHAGNKSELLKALSEHYANSKAIIDEDPGSIQPPHLQKFKEKQDLSGSKLRILHQKSKNNTLIILIQIDKFQKLVKDLAKSKRLRELKIYLTRDVSSNKYDCI